MKIGQDFLDIQYWLIERITAQYDITIRNSGFDSFINCFFWVENVELYRLIS